MDNFWAIKWIIHANFQVSSSTGVEEEWGNGRTRDVTPDPYNNFSTPTFARFTLGGIRMNNLLEP